VLRNILKSRLLAHRIGIILVLLAYGLTSLGCPLPSPKIKVGNVPFPCQDHPCGCQTAEECWQHCCCFTPAQHWAWAREHNVEPPSYAERPDADEDSTDDPGSLERPGHCKKNTCSHCPTGGSDKSCCQLQNEGPSEDRSVAPEHMANEKHHHDHHDVATHWLLGFSHGNCKGPGSSGSLAAAPGIPVPFYYPSTRLNPAFDQIGDAHFATVFLSFRPLTPPPRSIPPC